MVINYDFPSSSVEYIHRIGELEEDFHLCCNGFKLILVFKLLQFTCMLENLGLRISIFHQKNLWEPTIENFNVD